MDFSDSDDVVTTDISGHDPTDPWFFHRVIWKDADGDGDQDAFTCRTYWNQGDPVADFVYFENPGKEIVGSV